MTATIPLETQTLYAELLEHLLGVQAQRSAGQLSGSFVAKEIKGETYLYWQASQPGGRTRQFYLGRKSKDLDALIRRLKASVAEVAPDLERTRRLAAQLRAGGANVTDGPSARVIRSLAEAGMFDAGGVLVGTHAFVVLGNLLGTRWSSASLRRQAVDLASAADADIDLAIPEVETDVPSVLESLQMGFLPVPPLDRLAPSTSFKVRGQALRVDLLCPQRGGNEGPVFLPRWKAAAQPLVFLDYVLEAPERAVVINGGAALVNVPTPARFAFHKLLVAPMRAAAFNSKSAKDVAQASEVLDRLVEDRPGDLALAWDALCKRGTRWERAGRKGLALLHRQRPDVHARALPLLEKLAIRKRTKPRNPR